MELIAEVKVPSMVLKKVITQEVQKYLNELGVKIDIETNSVFCGFLGLNSLIYELDFYRK